MQPGDMPFRAEGAPTRDALPELPDALNWVNRRERVRLSELRGRIVLLVFWNATGTSSTNLLGELRQLEKKHPGAFVLLGVHTPRYASQQPDAAVLKALQRVRFRAPVANDPEWLAWKLYSIPAWPTTLLVDADGALAARFVGEGRGQEIEEAVAGLQEGVPPAFPHPSLELLENVR
ncbi:MAG: hypothetical protein ACREPH_09830, partial [Rhodanobacteraceae bacterium]